MFLKNNNIIFKTRRSKVTDYAALNEKYFVFFNMILLILLYLIVPKMEKIVKNMSSAIVIISALRVKF